MYVLRIEELGISLRVDALSPAAGRLRLAFPYDSDDEVGGRIEQLLQSQPGVEEVRREPRTHRVLVRYRNGSRLVGWIRELGEAVRGDPHPGSPDPPTAAPARIRLPTPKPSPTDGTPWHALATSSVLELLGTRWDGLDAQEVKERSDRFGPNAADEAAPRSRGKIFLDQISNLPTTLLVASSAASVLLGDLPEALVISAVVALNATIGFRVERKTEALLASWRRMESGSARVVRGGEIRIIPSVEVVPGDVLFCQAGDIVPADARVLDAHRLTCDEALLTGESEPQRKWPDPLPGEAPLAERRSMLFAGTVIGSGRGRAIATATGPATEMARVRSLVEEERAPKAPLEKRMERLAEQGTYWGAGAAGVVALAGLVRGRSPVIVLRSAIALAVAAFPEGLPVVVTAALVRAMGRLRDAGIVPRRLSAVETLGGVTVVCADKTGTLTRNEMQLELLDVDGTPIAPSSLASSRDGGDLPEAPAALALAAGVLNSDLEVLYGNGGVHVLASSTERAFVSAAQTAGLDLERLRRRYPRKLLRERQENVHYVVSQHDAPGGGSVLFLKGAPEQVLDLCDRDHARPLTDDSRRDVLERNEVLASRGLRVLALAWRRAEGDAPEDPRGFTFLALAALRDPLRSRAADAVRVATHAGIRTVIVTGDQRATAAAIAEQVGLSGEAHDGAELARLLDGAVNGDGTLERTSVLSRVTPAHKVQVVKALRERGHVVAMVGDGVNDAPALKAAHVGIAVGAGASDVARQTADVVLAHEDLRSILRAVGEGRIVQDNLRRAARYLFATNLSEVGLVLAGAVVGVEALTSLQLLWVNLLTDTLPALAIAFEPGEPDVLDRAPAPPDRAIIAPDEWRHVLRDGLLLAGLGGIALAAGGPAAAFAALPAAQLTYAVVCRAGRSDHGGMFPALVGGGAALHLGALLLPPLRAALKMPAPTAGSLLAYGVGILAPLVAHLFRSDEIVVKGSAQLAVA